MRSCRCRCCGTRPATSSACSTLTRSADVLRPPRRAGPSRAACAPSRAGGSRQGAAAERIARRGLQGRALCRPRGRRAHDRRLPGDRARRRMHDARPAGAACQLLTTELEQAAACRDPCGVSTGAPRVLAVSPLSVRHDASTTSASSPTSPRVNPNRRPPDVAELALAPPTARFACSSVPAPQLRRTRRRPLRIFL